MTGTEAIVRTGTGTGGAGRERDMPGLRQWLARIRLKLLDWLRYSIAVNHLSGLILIGGSAVAELASDRRHADRLLISGARRLYPLAPNGVVERRLRRNASIRSRDLHISTAGGEITRGIVLKPPLPQERGVLLLAFENQWMTLFETGAWQRVAEDFDLVLAPTWSPPYDAQMQVMARHWPRPFFTLVSNLQDAAVYPRWSPRIVPVPLLASSWVHPDLWRSTGLVKEHDIVVLANFSPYKRHFALFEAMSRMPAPPRALLTGVSWESYGPQHLHAMASLWGVARYVDIRENLSNAELRAAVESSRVAVFMARREGSCVAVAECLMQDIPVGMLADAHVGSRAFINDETGVLFARGASGTARGLQELLRRAPTFAPRAWMLREGHHCKHSGEVLNQTMRDHALANGQSWTRDLIPHCHIRLAPSHMRATDVATLRPIYEGFAQTYGVGLRLNAMEGIAP